MNRETIIQGLFHRPMDTEEDAVTLTDIIIYAIGGTVMILLIIIVSVGFLLCEKA